MEALEKISKIREYLDYLEKHIKNVEKAWEEVKVKLKEFPQIWDDYQYFSLDEAIKRHDISKVSKEEFIQYADFFYPCDSTLEDAKERIATEFNTAWQNHIKMNEHHWENWTTSKYRDNPYFDGVSMVHMVVDWLAMSYEFGDTPRQYYEANKEKIKIPETCEDLLERIFIALEVVK